MIAWLSTVASHDIAPFWLIAIVGLLRLTWEVVSTIAWGPRVRVRTVHRYAKAAEKNWPPAQAPTTDTLASLTGPLPHRTPGQTRIDQTLSGRELFAPVVERRIS